MSLLLSQISWFKYLGSCHFYNEAQRFDNMKPLGFRTAFLSTEENAGTRTKSSQITEPQMFYIVCCVA